MILVTPAHAARGWIDRVEVLELVPTGRHYYEVKLAVSNNPSGCGEKEWFYLNYQAAGADKMFDLFVDALQGKLRLKVYVTGVCNLKGYAEISSVSALPI